MSIAIPFQFYQTRINTDYNKLRTLFKPEAEFHHWLQQQLKVSGIDASISVVKLHELNLESAATSYSFQGNDGIIAIYVDFMQSTARTSRCFDVFLRIEGSCAPGLLEELGNYLETLRQRYNGAWHINDPQLTFDILK